MNNEKETDILTDQGEDNMKDKPDSKIRTEQGETIVIDESTVDLREEIEEQLTYEFVLLELGYDPINIMDRIVEDVMVKSPEEVLRLPGVPDGATRAHVIKLKKIPLMENHFCT